MPHVTNFFTEQERRENEQAGERAAAGSPAPAGSAGVGAERRRVKPVAVAAVVLLAVIGAFAMLAAVFGRGGGKQDGPAASPAPGSRAAVLPAAAASLPEPGPEPGPTPEPTPAGPQVSAEDWFAVLVDMQHPLPEDYDPETDLVDPVGYYFDSRAAGELLAMLQAARDADMELKLASGFRSRARQDQLHGQEVAYWRGQGLGADEAYSTALRYEEPAGYSEHNSGLAVDLVAMADQREAAFAGTPEYMWLTEHAAEFGFILRYPEGKQAVTGMEPKPWHWRYVGAELARFLTEQGLTLNEYYSLYLG